MIKSATQYPVHNLISHESNTQYRVPPFQREYSWQKQQWEELFDDLIEADGAHFLGTIICLNSTVDAVEANVLELIDGQQRMTTITLLLAAVHSILDEHKDELDDDEKADLANLRRQLVRKHDSQPRVRPQRQGSNLDDYLTLLSRAGLPVESTWIPYMPLRKMSRCYEHFRREIHDLAEDQGVPITDAAQQVAEAALKAIIVKIEVDSHADAFVLFESLNNRGMPLTPVDLIKNHLLAEAERLKVMDVEEAFKRWNVILTNLGDNYSNQERFLRHYYNAFKNTLPTVPKATVATRSNLIRIFEALIAQQGVREFIQQTTPASAIYGRITNRLPEDRSLDTELAALARAQGAPSYMLLLYLMTNAEPLRLDESDIASLTRLLTNFFVRRNLTGTPQTYALPRIFMDIIDRIEGRNDGDVHLIVEEVLLANSASDETFRERLMGPIYEDNSDVTRFLLTSIAESGMTKETRQDLWLREKNRYVWTIEHILPQGENLPAGWQEMLGGKEHAGAVQAKNAHRLGNLTITGYNSSLGNKSFDEKKDRKDTEGNWIGYRNGLRLNDDVVTETEWTAEHIERRTKRLANLVLDTFPLSAH